MNRGMFPILSIHLGRDETERSQYTSSSLDFIGYPLDFPVMFLSNTAMCRPLNELESVLCAKKGGPYRL